MIRRKLKALNFENHTLSISINNIKEESIKPVDLKAAQSSVLNPQSLTLSPDKFAQVCKELMSEGHGVKFSAPGGSMYPTICDGDVITVQPIKPPEVALGDIILYRYVNGVIAHRVVSINASQSSDLSPQYFFTFRGDAAINDDLPVGSEQVLGRVVSIERNGRRLDPYCLRVKLLFKIRRLTSRLKRYLVGSKTASV